MFQPHLLDQLPALITAYPALSQDSRKLLVYSRGHIPAVWEAAAAHEVTQVIYYIVSLNPVNLFKTEDSTDILPKSVPAHFQLTECCCFVRAAGFSHLHTFTFGGAGWWTGLWKKKTTHNSLILYLNSLDRGHFSMCSIAVVMVYILTQMSSP